MGGGYIIILKNMVLLISNMCCAVVPNGEDTRLYEAGRIVCQKENNHSNSCQ